MPFRKIAVIVLWGTVLCRPAMAGESLPDFKDWPYLKAKEGLISMGIIPVRIVRHVTWLPCPDDETCKAYPELLQCSGTGLALCEFVFFDSKRQKYILLTTYGETKWRVLQLVYATKEDFAGWSPSNVDRGFRRKK